MIPKEHQLKCETCGEIIDMRDLSQVLSHGFKNENTGAFECKPVEADYATSRKVGDSVEWTKDKKPLHNN